MENWNVLKNYEYLNWGMALLGSIFIFVFLRGLQNLFVRNGRVRAETTEVVWDDLVIELLANVKKYFVLTLSIYLSLIWIELNPYWRSIIDKVFIIVALIQVSKLAGLVINFWITKRLKVKSEQNPEMASTIGLISIAVKALTYSLLVLLALTNLGFDITALIAGLGVGGIAIALAMQNILTDLFSSLTIVLDKPFIVGDFIIVGDMLGTVEHIGLKTTRVRSLSGEQLVFGNGDLLQSRIKNYKRMYERRIVQSLTVTYQTDPAVLEKIPLIIRKIVEGQDHTRFDRCHFLKFLDSSLEFELVYWISSPDFNFYADRAHAINIAIYKAFNEQRINFAYPTRTLFIQPPEQSAKG